MLPPFLPSIVDIKANWVPKGWSDGKELPKESLEGVEKIRRWQGLVMNEGVVAQAIRRSVRFNRRWFNC